eukprot:gene6846-biopygen3882
MPASPIVYSPPRPDGVGDWIDIRYVMRARTAEATMEIETPTAIKEWKGVVAVRVDAIGIQSITTTALNVELPPRIECESHDP